MVIVRDYNRAMQKGKQRTWVLRMRAVDRLIFRAVVSGRKTLETRALNDSTGPRYYGNIAPGDLVLFTCGKARIRKTVGAVHRYRSVATLLRSENFKHIAPWASSKADAARMYATFPGYPERIRRYGIICFELKRP
jgi:ASC-1-like (ASCH) protein